MGAVGQKNVDMGTYRYGDTVTWRHRDMTTCGHGAGDMGTRGYGNIATRGHRDMRT